MFKTFLNKIFGDTPVRQTESLQVKSSDNFVTINGIPGVLVHGGSDGYSDKKVPPNIECYARIAAVNQAINAITAAIASAALRIYNAKHDDESNRPEFRPLYYPNFRQTQNDFWRGYITHLELCGDTYWYLQRDNRGKIIEVFLMRPDKTEIIPDKFKYIKGYNYYVNSEKKFYPAEDVFHMRLFNPTSDYYGLSRISAVQDELSLFLNAQVYSKMFFVNGATPAGIVKANEVMDDITHKQFVKNFKKNYTGTDNAHKIMFLEGADFQATLMPMKDIEFLNLRKMTKNEVGAVFGVPPMFMSDLSDSGKISNTAEQKLMFWQNCIIPRLSDLEMVFNQFLIPLLLGEVNTGHYCKFDLSHVDVLQDLQKKKLDFYQLAFNMGAITPDEIRVDVLNKDPLNTPESRSVYLPFGMTPAGEVKPIKTLPGESGKSAGHSDAMKIALKAVFDTMRLRREKTMLKTMRGLFVKQKETVLGNLQNQRLSDISELSYKSVITEDIFDLEFWNNEFIKQLDPVIASMILESAKFTSTAWNLGGTPLLLTDPRIQQLVGQRILEFSKINLTTMSEIRNALQAGLAAQEDISQLTDRVSQVFAEASGARAQTIAVTETTYAQNGGAMAAMKNAGIERKTWLTSQDNLVRETHQQANEQTVGIDDKFYVGGEYLDFPGGGEKAENNINCRCRVIPVAEPA